MTAAALALRDAVLATLRAAPSLAAAPLAGRIHDGAPRDPVFPHLVLDEVTTRDRSGLDAGLDEHRLVLRVLSRAGGRREALVIAADAEAALAAAAPSLVGHRPVLLRREATDMRWLRDRLTAEVVLRFVALTEPV